AEKAAETPPETPVATSETGEKVEPVAASAAPDKLAQREIEQAGAARAAIDGRPGIDPEATPPHSPPVAFDAGNVLPQKVPHASPAVRLFARELGVDLSQVRGSERAGRITREDVQRYVKATLASGAAPAAAGNGLSLLPWP